jgi:predicted MFS family arabinose efflux permease
MSPRPLGAGWMAGLPADVRVVLAAQGLRAFAYGLGAVLLGRTLAAQRLGGIGAGLVLAATVAGTAIASLVVARCGDRVGRRRSYRALYVLLAVTGMVFTLAGSPWLLVAAGLLGAMSSEVIESGPFTSLEQAMLATDLTGRRRVHGFGLYNAVAALAGSLGALAAALPAAARHLWPGAPGDQRWFLLFVPVALAGAVLAGRLTNRVEATGPVQPTASRPQGTGSGLDRSRRTVTRLAGLFAVDSFAGGITVSAFIAYWLTTRFAASATTIAVTFAVLGLLQTASFLAAPLIAERIGLLATMVFTHLASDLFLAAVAFAPSLPVAIGLLAARTSLSQMDVPTRQAYVMALVDPGERTAAAAYTGTVRYLTRPFGPPVAGLAQTISLGLPFLLSGALKAGYDLTLWAWFRHVPLPAAQPPPAGTSAGADADAVEELA